MPPKPAISDLNNVPTVRLSNRQHAALKLFVTRKSIPFQEALAIDQRSFGSLYHREYIDFNARTKDFTLATAGRDAMETFEHTSVIKDAPGAYFSRHLQTIRALSEYQRAITVTNVKRTGK